MQLSSGTSGYSYKEWKGPFYPDDLPASGMLRFYADRFRAVEINNTFYRMPNKSLLGKWASEVPERFTFVLKAPQRITHVRRLKDADSEVEHFFDVATELGPKLGATLFQLPPFARKDIDRLRAFLAILPKDRRAAFEFRHPSWIDEEVHAALRASGAALCFADMEDEASEEASGPATRSPRPAVPLVSTASWGYLRLRRCDYTDDDLRKWIARIRAQPWSDVYVFFKHEDEATGPKLAARFTALFEDGPASCCPHP